jgi:hypothetical protein
LFTVDQIAKPSPTAAQTLEDQQFEDPESQELFLDCLTLVWHRDIHLFARQMEEYSNEAHLSAVKAAIHYLETLSDTNLQNQDDCSPDFEGKDDDSFSLLQNPTETPSSQKIFIERFLSVQLYTGHFKCATTLNFVFVHVQVIPDHGKKGLYSL